MYGILYPLTPLLARYWTGAYITRRHQTNAGNGNHSFVTYVSPTVIGVRFVLLSLSPSLLRVHPLYARQHTHHLSTKSCALTPVTSREETTIEVRGATEDPPPLLTTTQSHLRGAVNHPYQYSRADEMNQNTQPNVGPVANSGSGTQGAGAPPPVEPSIKRVGQCPPLIKIDGRLDDTNWCCWRFEISLVLELCELDEYVKGEIARPDPVEDPVGADNWSFNDTYAKLLISINITSSEKMYISRCTTSHDMWAKLEAVHQSDQLLSIYRDGLFHTHAEDGDDISEHLNKLLRYREGINLIGNDDDSIPDLLFKGIINASLPPSWDELISPYVVGESKDIVTPLQLIAMIKQKYYLDEERKQQEVKHHRTNVFGMSCTQCQRSNTDRSCSKDSQNLGKNHCGKCGKLGHMQDECWSVKNKKRKRDIDARN